MLLLVATYALLQPLSPLDTLTSGLASITRLPYGTNVAEARTASLPAEHDLVLYEYEASPYCRRVRECITYLDLCCTIKPCGKSSRHRTEAEEIAGRKPTYPFLVDKGADGISMFESEDICSYLTKTYGGDGVAPLPERPVLLCALPSFFRPARGAFVEECARDRPPPAEPLRLYSYDGNQFCRPVREALCELDLPYELRSTGKGSLRRQELQELSGKTTAPFLVDPNTGTAMGESADIVQYLIDTYADGLASSGGEPGGGSDLLASLNAFLDKPILDTGVRGGPLEPFKRFARINPEVAQVAASVIVVSGFAVLARLALALAAAITQ